MTTPGAFDPYAHDVFWIGAAAIEPSLHQIRRGGRAFKIEPQVMAVLLFLAARSGAVVSRTALLDAVWAGVHPNDEGLTQAVCKLRKAFGDRARQPAVIETIPKVGYRLIAPVSATPPAVPGPEPPTPPPGRPPDARPGVSPAWRWATMGLSLMMLLGGGLWVADGEAAPTRRIQIRYAKPLPAGEAPATLKIRRVRIRAGLAAPDIETPHPAPAPRGRSSEEL